MIKFSRHILDLCPKNFPQNQKFLTEWAIKIVDLRGEILDYLNNKGAKEFKQFYEFIKKYCPQFTEKDLWDFHQGRVVDEEILNVLSENYHRPL